MYWRKIIAWTCILVFLSGSVGHVLSLHYCSTAGKTYVENLFSETLPCEKAEKVPAKSCCAREKLCEKPAESQEDEGCCSHTTVYLKLTQAHQESSTWTGFSVPAFSILSFESPLEFVFPLIPKTDSFFAERPPPLSSALYIAFRVFRI